MNFMNLYVTEVVVIGGCFKKSKNKSVCISDCVGVIAYKIIIIINFNSVPSIKN